MITNIQSKCTFFFSFLRDGIEIDELKEPSFLQILEQSLIFIRASDNKFVTVTRTHHLESSVHSGITDIDTRILSYSAFTIINKQLFYIYLDRLYHCNITVKFVMSLLRR